MTIADKIEIAICNLPSPWIVNLVAPSKLPEVGVIFVTRPPENKIIDSSPFQFS